MCSLLIKEKIPNFHLTYFQNLQYHAGYPVKGETQGTVLAALGKAKTTIEKPFSRLSSVHVAGA